MTKLIQTQYLTYQDPASPLLRTTGNFLLGESRIGRCSSQMAVEPSTLDSLSVSQGWFMLLGQLFSSTLRKVDASSYVQPFDTTIVPAFASALRDKTAHWSLCLEDRALPSLCVARTMRRSEDKYQQLQGDVSARVQTISPVFAAQAPSHFLSMYLGWNGLASMCKSHVLDQAIFTDTVLNREKMAMIGPLDEIAASQVKMQHQRYSPLVTPLTCLRRFMLLPHAIRRFLWAESDNVEPAAPLNHQHAHHFVDPDGQSMRQHSIFPYPLYAPHCWSFWSSTDHADASLAALFAPGSIGHSAQLKLEFEQTVVFEAVLAPFISTYRFLQTASADHVRTHPTHPGLPSMAYDTQNDVWNIAYPSDMTTNLRHPFKISLARLYHEFTVPVPASLRMHTEIMRESYYVDIRDLVCPNNNFTIIGTAFYRLYHLHRLLQVAVALDDRCMLHVVQQVIDSHVPLLAMMTEHCFYQDDVLLSPWNLASRNYPEHGFKSHPLRQASHPLSPNALNEYAGVSLEPIPLVDVGAIPRVFFVWPNDSRYRVTLEESVSLSTALNGLGYFVRKQEARTATQDWADPALALKSLLTKYFPLRNFKRADKRIAFNCFDAHPGLAVTILNLLHVSQLANVPGTDHRPPFICRMRHWSFHYTSSAIASRDIKFIDHACFQQWRTFHRASVHELIGFYTVNCLPHLASTIFAHPRQGILYLKWITGVRYIMNVARRRYMQMPFIGSNDAYYHSYLSKNGDASIYAATFDALGVLMLSQEIMIQRESDLMTKKLNIFMHHATETEAMSRWFWTLLDQLANRVLTTLRFLHRARAPWSPESANGSTTSSTSTAGTASSSSAAVTSGTASQGLDDDAYEEDGRDTGDLSDVHGSSVPDHSDSLYELNRGLDSVGLSELRIQSQSVFGAAADADMDVDDSPEPFDFLAADEFADAVNFDDDDEEGAAAADDTDGVTGGLFARLFTRQDSMRSAQIRRSSVLDDHRTNQTDHEHSADEDEEESFNELIETLDRATRIDTAMDISSAEADEASDASAPGDHEASETARQRRERRSMIDAYLHEQRCRIHEDARDQMNRLKSTQAEAEPDTSTSRSQKVVTAHGLEAWSLNDEQMNGVMQQFVRSLSYVPSLDDPGQEERHESFRRFCYLVQRHSRPSSQERIPLLALAYFGLSRKGLDFVHRLRVYDRHGLPPNRLETMVRLFWLKFPTDFALIARYLKYIQLYSMDQMLLLPRDIAETQYASRVQAVHGNVLCYRIRRQQIQAKIDKQQASSFEKQTLVRMSEALHVSCFCISCRNWTEPLAPVVLTTYSEQAKVPFEERRFKRQRLALGIQSEGRQTKNPVSSSKRSSSRARPGAPDTSTQAAAASANSSRLRLSHLPNIDPRRTVADFVSGVVRCLSDARARSSIGFSALLTELAYGRGISLKMDVLESNNYPLYVQRRWYTADRMIKWLTYARLVHLFPIRPEQLDALMKQVSEIYPQLAKRIQKDGFVATSVTAACPSELVSTYMAQHGSTIDVDVMNEIEMAMEKDDDDDAADGVDSARQPASASTATTGASSISNPDSAESAAGRRARSNEAGKRTKAKKPKIGMSHTVDPEVQRFLPEYHFDSRVRLGQTNGMVHDEVLRDVSDVIRDGIASIREVRSKTTRSICGAVAERVDMIGKIFFAPPHTHSINLYNSYVCCSLCPMIMRAQESQFSDTPGVGYVCAKHSGMLRPIDPTNCDLDQINTGGGGAYFPRIASLDPLGCSNGHPTELVASHTYYASQPTHLLGIPPQWWAVHAAAGHSDLAQAMTPNFSVPAKCDKCPQRSCLYAHVIQTLVLSKTTGSVTLQRLCENCHRRFVSKFQTRQPRKQTKGNSTLGASSSQLQETEQSQLHSDDEYRDDLEDDLFQEDQEYDLTHVDMNPENLYD